MKEIIVVIIGAICCIVSIYLMSIYSLDRDFKRSIECKNAGGITVKQEGAWFCK